MLQLRINYKAATIKWLLVAILTGFSTHYINAKNQSYSYSNDNPWRSYPFSIQVNPHIGLTLPLCLQDLATFTGKPRGVNLLALGGSLDLGILYANRWFLKHFDCYPKLGLLLKYDYLSHETLDQGGHIAGGIFYIEPNYDHLSKWEVVPRLGAGASYIHIPHSNEKNTTDSDDEEDEEAVNTIFRNDIGLNFLLDLLVKYRFSPHLHFNGSIGADIMPYLIKSDEPNGNSGMPPRHLIKSIIIYRLSLGCSYTFKPSNYHPIRMTQERKNRVDISYLNAIRRPRNFLQKDDMEDSFCYIGGIHAQWSMRITKNHALILGSEWIQDDALAKELTAKSYVRESSLQTSVMVGHEFLWGKFNCGQYFGFYILNNSPKSLIDRFKPISNLFYTRLGLNYQITDHFHIGTNLKVSLFPTSTTPRPTATAYTRFEYIDFRIGYSF